MHDGSRLNGLHKIPPMIQCEGTETMSKTNSKKIRKRKSRGKEIPGGS